MKTTKTRSVASKTSAMALILIIIGMTAIGLLGFFMHHNEIINARAGQALSVAKSVEPFVNDGTMLDALDSLTPDEAYQAFLQDISEIKTNTNAAYLYILDMTEDGSWRYFAEAMAPGDSAENIGTLGQVEGDGIFPDEAMDAYQNNRYTTTDIYLSDGYGYLVSGFAPVTDSSGKTIGVIGVDISVDEVNRTSAFFGILMAAIVVGFSVFSGICFRRYINKNVGTPVNELASASTKMAVGDMGVKLSYDSEDEIGTLSKSFQSMVESTKHQVNVLGNIADGDLTTLPAKRSDQDAMSLAMQKMVVNLRNIVNKISTGTQQVMDGSKQVADGATALAQGAIEQASVVTALSDSISDVADKTKKNTARAETAAELTRDIRENAEKSSAQMNALMRAVTEINEASDSISKIMRVIDEISFQTNILALNAAVEAARAGENGKGFAVVADEVRNLAAKSAVAAKESSVLIANSISKAEEGAKIARISSESLADIVSGINESTELINKIAELSVTQNAQIEKIHAGINDVNQVVQQNSATAQQSAAASQEMSGQAHMLNDLVSLFKVDKTKDQ